MRLIKILLCSLLLATHVIEAKTPDITQISAYSKNTHFIQFFSTGNPTKAEGIKNTLVLQGYPAFVSINTPNKKTYYQVQVGPFASRDSAQKAKSKVIKTYPQYKFLNDAILKTTL